jgi:hypothetical protein
VGGIFARFFLQKAARKGFLFWQAFFFGLVLKKKASGSK